MRRRRQEQSFGQKPRWAGSCSRYLGHVLRARFRPKLCVMAWYFTFFFISGLCGIVYELVWLRLAMAQFGVTTALTSIVLSMFMAGLGLGSWAAGSLVRAYGKRVTIHP